MLAKRGHFLEVRTVPHNFKGLGPHVLKLRTFKFIKSELTVEMCDAPRQLQGIYLYVFLVWHVCAAGTPSHLQRVSHTLLLTGRSLVFVHMCSIPRWSGCIKAMCFDWCTIRFFFYAYNSFWPLAPGSPCKATQRVETWDLVLRLGFRIRFRLGWGLGWVG